ncbi:hypothetical protein NDU88_006354 [Pleurodeles waltl]|uniref:Uncharacterized protein n=1 Tax=Pleurodeles waltl TaxID=8319 RepID=A0AAV7N109_PLEWA|nr:hypothetical protein NDU88_006354 [Pleurodeles waltl]
MPQVRSPPSSAGNGYATPPSFLHFFWPVTGRFSRLLILSSCPGRCVGVTVIDPAGSGRLCCSLGITCPTHCLQDAPILQRVHRQAQALQPHPRPGEPSEPLLLLSPAQPEPGLTSLLSPPGAGSVMGFSLLHIW